MAKDLNHVVLIGRLVRDPETRYTSSNVAVTKFSIANNDSYMKDGQRQEIVSYFDVNVWGNQAVNCEKYLKMGNQVAVEGYLRQNRWKDQATGQTRSKVEITASSVQFLTPPSGNNNVRDNQANYSNQQQGRNENVNNNYQNNGPANNQGFIPNPWDEGNNNSGAGGTGYDDDIPF